MSASVTQFIDSKKKTLWNQVCSSSIEREALLLYCEEMNQSWIQTALNVNFHALLFRRNILITFRPNVTTILRLCTNIRTHSDKKA